MSPPMVGVPAFTACVTGPSVLTVSLNFSPYKYAMIRLPKKKERNMDVSPAMRARKVT